MVPWPPETRRGVPNPRAARSHPRRSGAPARRAERAFLAILLLHANEVVSTDRLIDRLWGGDPPTTAARRSRSTSRGCGRRSDRRPRHEGARVPRPRGAGRARPAPFRGARHAGARGGAATSPRPSRARRCRCGGEPPLADFAYEAFAQAEIARLEELRLAALEERIEAELALGRDAELVGELETLVAEHPLRERLRGQLMLALYRSGRQAEALAVYRDGRRLLDDELGLEPSESLKELERAILAHDPCLDRSSRSRAARPPQRSIVVVPRNLDGLEASLRWPRRSRVGRPRVSSILATSRRRRLSATSAAPRASHQAALARARGPRGRVLVARSRRDDLVRLESEHDIDLLLLDDGRDPARPDPATGLSNGPRATSRCSSSRWAAAPWARSSCRSVRPSTTGRRSSSVPGSPERPAGRCG